MASISANGVIAARDGERLRQLGLVARVFLGIYVVVWAASAVLLAWWLFVALGFEYGMERFDPFAMLLSGLFGLAATIGILAFLPAAVLFLVWFHRAIANLEAAGLPGLKVAAGWAVGSFFVPGPNFYVPPLAMRELWNRSHGEDEWQAGAAVGEVSTWWTCYCAGSLILFIQLAIAVFTLLTGIHVTVPHGTNEAMLILGMGFWCVAAASLMGIVRKVGLSQSDTSHLRQAFA